MAAVTYDRIRVALCLLLCAGLAGVLAGCAQSNAKSAPPPQYPPCVLVVAPVLNLSGARDVDSLKLTDLLASEFVSFPGTTVVPVNRVLAELLARGKTTVESPEDALALARAFDADAAIVVALTEYNPYAPPVVGLVMQWYDARGVGAAARGAPVAAREMPAQNPRGGAVPRWQIQRVFNAAQEEVQEQVQHYADERDGHRSPYGWRKYLESQELYVRYCCWALIKTIRTLDHDGRVTVEPNEAQS
jgi:hypothetical protein